MTAAGPVTRIAADQFRRRQGFARREVAAGRWTVEKAEAKLRPWLAICAACGADLPELRVRVLPLVPEGEEREERLASWAICPPREWLDALEEARDSALAAHDAAPADPDREARARDLVRLAHALGAGPIRPRNPAKEAA